MKVLSFIEYTNLTFIESYEYFIPFETFLSKHIKWSENEDGEWDILKFYSQSFKPELIVELFEGWNKINDKHYDNFKYTDSAHIDKDYQSLHFTRTYMEVTYKCQTKRFYIPRTLDDFINDTQRAGIELEWRLK